MERRLHTKDQAAALPDILLKLNRTIHRGTGKSPYMVIFGCKRCWNCHLLPTEQESATLDNVSDAITHELPFPD